MVQARNPAILRMTTKTLRLRGGHASDRGGNPSCLEERVRLFSSLAGSPSIGTGCYDDKNGKTECNNWTLKNLEKICPKYFAF